MSELYPAGADSSPFCPWEQADPWRDCATCANWEDDGWCPVRGEYVEPEPGDDCKDYEHDYGKGEHEREQTV